MILKIEEIGSNAVITASTNTVKFPVSNILDSRLSRVYRTDLATTSEIVFDLGSALSISSLVLANHNISSSVTTLKLQGNSSNSWGSPSFEQDLTWNQKNIPLDFIETTLRYWRIQIIDATNPDLFIQLGRVWLGLGYNTAGIKVLVIHDRKSATKKTITPSGQSYGDKRFFYSLVSIKFPKITRIQYNEIIDLFEIADISTPFFVTFDKGGNILETLYVTYDQDGLKLTPLGNRDLYTTSLQFIEEVK